MHFPLGLIAISQCHYIVHSSWACFQSCHVSFHYEPLNHDIVLHFMDEVPGVGL